MTNGREQLGLGWRWRKGAAVAIAIIGAVAIGSFILPQVEAQQRDKLGLPLPGAPVEPAEVENMAFPLPDKPSLAVLAFDNLIGDADQDYFVDGFVDDLITDLSKISTIFVVSRNSTFTYKGAPVKIRQVAEELGVRYVLEGSIRRAGGTIRVNAQLIDALSGNHVWAERFDGDAADIFALQDEINDKIVAALSENVSLQLRHEARRRETESPEAWDAFRQGWTHLERRTAHRNGLANALFKKAVELDPNYPSALALLAGTYMDAIRRFSADWRREIGVETHEEAIAEFKPLLAKALEHPTAFTYLIDAQWAEFQGQRERALTQAQRAVDLAPYSQGALHQLATALIYAGRPEEGLARADEMQRLDPKGGGGPRARGIALFNLERYEEAAAAFQAYRAARPNSFAAMLLLTATYAQLDRQEEMQAVRDLWFARVQKRSGGLPKISRFHRAFPFSKPEDRERFESALRKAGLDE